MTQWISLPAPETVSPACQSVCANFAPDHVAQSILPTMLSASPFLSAIADKETQLLHTLFEQGTDAVFHTVLEPVQAAITSAIDRDEVSKLLRLTRRKVALLCAVAECGGNWSTAQATHALASFADAAVSAGLMSLLNEQLELNRFNPFIETISNDNCGLAVFALGKHGGQELNYSSDIDIVAFFDPVKNILKDHGEATKFYSRIMQNLGNLLQDRDEFGYVFRTDLRLRPDPSSTPVAMSVDAALTYYESRGQNWERAAWSKARVCAGDRDVAGKFLKELSPYIWRKHLDFAAIADIQAMKRQINISKNVGGQRLAGHNVKLGRGGIREIEFFAQTQLLIAGGRDQSLRVIPTEKALAALAKAGWISDDTATELTRTYWFLRAVENRVQMIADEQTHMLPTEEEKLNEIAALMRFDTLAQFEKAYLAALDLVTRNYADLFHEQGDLSSTEGNLVFTGTDDDPQTLETLSAMGFSSPSAIIQIVKKWHYGSYAATRSAAARAHLTELLPLLLTTLSAGQNADDTLRRFDQFLSKLPAGVELFAMMRAHDELCHFIISLLASAPKMADAIIRRAHVLDGLIDPARSAEMFDATALGQRVDDFLGQSRAYEDLIDRARMVGQEERFLISASMISGAISSHIAGQQFTALAETLVRRLFQRAQDEFALRHGIIEGAQTALIAMGKLGSGEMTANSDLDLILIYDVPDRSAVSNGDRPLDPALYFARLTQRLITALSAPTATGVLYEVDMRLRPSGNKGPVATSLASFTDYQMQSAWTWEHLALTRARVFSSSPDFAAQLTETIDKALAKPRDHAETLRDVRDMRERLKKDRPAKHPFDVKLADGGLMDIDFICQSAILLDPNAEQMLPMRTSIAQLIQHLGELGRVDSPDELLNAYHLMSTIVHCLSACLTDPFAEAEWTQAFKALLTRATHAPDFARLEQDLAEAQKQVRSAAQTYYGYLADQDI